MTIKYLANSHGSSGERSICVMLAPAEFADEHMGCLRPDNNFSPKNSLHLVGSPHCCHVPFNSQPVCILLAKQKNERGDKLYVKVGIQLIQYLTAFKIPSWLSYRSPSSLRREARRQSCQNSQPSCLHARIYQRKQYNESEREKQLAQFVSIVTGSLD